MFKKSLHSLNGKHTLVALGKNLKADHDRVIVACNENRLKELVFNIFYVFVVVLMFLCYNSRFDVSCNLTGFCKLLYVAAYLYYQYVAPTTKGY